MKISTESITSSASQYKISIIVSAFFTDIFFNINRFCTNLKTHTSAGNDDSQSNW